MNRSRNDTRDYTVQLRAAMRRYLPWRGLPLIGPGRWTDRLLVTVMLLMAFSSLGSLGDRFAEARAAVVRMYVSRRRPGKSYAGFIRQWQRRSGRLLDVVTSTLRQRMVQDAGACWKVGRHLAFGVDGTKADAPRTKANQKKLRIGGRHKSGPQQLLVTLLHVGTGLPWSWRRGSARGSEPGLLLEQLGVLPAGSLLLMDAGFTGYGLLGKIAASGQEVLLRAGANVRLLRKLGWVVKEQGNLVYLWPARAQDQGMPPVVLRQIVVSDGRNRRMCLLTSVLLEADLSVAEAVELYRRRWGVELFYRGLKQTLGRRKMLSDAPVNAGMELDWTMVGYWLLGLLLREHRREPMPATCGVAAALRLVRQAMAGRGDGRGRWAGAWEKLRVDHYRRRRPKAARNWPHKKNEPPCGVPKLRMATPHEIRLAKGLCALKCAA
jgi:Transposase DDE domain